jgi:hypothetical protein
VPIVDRYHSIPIPTEAQQSANDARDIITVKVEFVRMKTSQKDGKGDRGENKNQLYGNLSYAILGAGDKSLRSGSFWDKTSNNYEEFTVDSWSNFNNKNTQLKIPRSKLAETRLMIYGKVSEEDKTVMAKDDVYFDMPNAVDGEETTLDVLQVPGDSKEITVVPSGEKGVIQILVRLTWVK